MAKKQTRRSISVSRTTYERLKAFCETNNISMSQLVETRVNDFLGTSDAPAVAATSIRPAMPPRPMMPSQPPVKPATSTGMASPSASHAHHSGHASSGHASSPSSSHPAPPMTSAAARFAVEPPPPIIKPRQDTAAPKPAEKRPEQIFTF